MSYKIGEAQVSNWHLALFVSAPLVVVSAGFVYRKYAPPQKPLDIPKGKVIILQEEHASTPSDAVEAGEMKEETLHKVQEEQLESAPFVRLKGTPSLDRDLDGFVDRDVHFEDKRVSVTADIRFLYKDE